MPIILLLNDYVYALRLALLSALVRETSYAVVSRCCTHSELVMHRESMSRQGHLCHPSEAQENLRKKRWKNGKEQEAERGSVEH